MVIRDKKELLANSELLSGLDGDMLDRLLSMTVTRKLAKNETLFVKGDPGDSLFGVQEGKIKIVTTSPNGKEVTLNIIEEGQFFGEIALLDGMDRTADAVAMEKSELLVIQRRDFIPFLEKHPKLCIQVMQLLCHRVRITSEMVEDAAFLPLDGRLAKRLLNLAELYGEEGENGGVLIGLNLPQQELARMMGTSRESVNKQLQIWRGAGWIELARGKVTLMDEDALRDVLEAAEFD
ncbi:cAMP-binding protein-catabolite gene activator and regulatory subunit of cAMP-dependent protein kinase [Candidatus Terasakiella magnetica]|uniref:cAMP-binding protein-catabolite gene activator and regulatory subunit of cAMP-dependent protein kinase n=1 Tax=Candidatus Terasakiella magnetica TaxID=1867952 RepID=A0A1C3RLX0_9PROT|nr:Crp/Fnr family transcriptional regulator [Candidatus Terasakiella magnetica]SCA58253.1 cAMP-binding protein-catabolite gene activator and regulatory subunit of cAMP-dependent protein kinase [Candidatus Terasakiella magnetica]